MKRGETIVKVQAALNNPGRVLIYNKNRSVIQESVEPAIYRQVMDAWEDGDIELPKIYCVAKIARGEINLRGMAPHQEYDW